MANNQQQIISHLNNDIYNNGLKFERDRSFRNKLIVKAIVIMALLLVLAVVLCVTMAKSSNSTKAYNQTRILKLYQKVPLRYDPDSLEAVKEREVLQELKTTFIQNSIGYANPSVEMGNSSDVKERVRRQNKIILNFEMEKVENKSEKTKQMEEVNMHSTNFDMIWLTGSDVFQRQDENKTFQPINEQNNIKTDEKNKFNDRFEDISMFWKEEMDEYSIRSIQAEKMLSYMDQTANPCEDFYQYACGNWEKINPIPDDKAGIDTFEMLRESLDSILRDLLLEPSDDNVSLSEQKAKDLFESCMDEDTIQERGNKPLYVLIRELKGWPMIHPDWNSSDFDWIELMAELRLYNNDVLLAHWVGPDIKNSAQYIIQFDQTTLGLPTRDYFLQPSNSLYVEAYKTYIIQVAVLLGAERENVTSDAEDLINFEKRLAGITSGMEDRRNVTELYVKMTLFDLSALIPRIDWMRYLTIVLSREIDPSEEVVVFALKYFQDLVKVIDTTPPRTIANYLLWRFMRHRVNNLGKEFQDAKQDFYYALFGREKAPPRWNTCVSQVNTNMGMALGSMFVKRYFDESSKNDVRLGPNDKRKKLLEVKKDTLASEQFITQITRIIIINIRNHKSLVLIHALAISKFNDCFQTVRMTRDIMHSFTEILEETDWIDPTTKSFAKNKVMTMVLRIGYPDFILDEEELNERYKLVNISKTLYFENTLNLLRHLARSELNRLGTVVNKTQWNTPPAVVNAYYSRNKNQIMFPAGILQPPFYHKYFPRSLNYGGIGVVIGHEITHGFDDKGRLFDRDGNLNRWWDEGAVEKFHQKAKCLIDQYSAYTVREIDIQIDGVHTQGENIADNGGIKQAYRAYEKWLKFNNSTDETLPGLNATNFQLFFLNFAQVWCGGMRPEASRNKLKTAVHSPGKFRVIGTLSNSEEFARAFNCSSNTKMNPDKKCKVW